MTNKFNLNIQLPTRENETEIEVTTEGYWENDGIGSYEFWGQKCHDSGTVYFSIEGWNWDNTPFTKEENWLIEDAIQNQLEKWGETVQPATENDHEDAELPARDDWENDTPIDE